jgi:hypothetical protein
MPTYTGCLFYRLIVWHRLYPQISKNTTPRNATDANRTTKPMALKYGDMGATIKIKKKAMCISKIISHPMNNDYRHETDHPTFRLVFPTRYLSVRDLWLTSTIFRL